MRLEEKIAKLCVAKHKTLGIAESCTGGLLTHVLTNVPGSSAFLLLGMIAYDNAAKIKLLRVSKKLLKQYGAVSPQAALQMAHGIRAILKTDIGIAITGIAGPGGGSPQKPVGLIYIAIETEHTAIAHEFFFKGDRLANKESSVNAALKILLQTLAEN